MHVVVYSITGDTLRYLGLSHITDLPEYEKIQKQLKIESVFNQDYNEVMDETENIIEKYGE